MNVRQTKQVGERLLARLRTLAFNLPSKDNHDEAFIGRAKDKNDNSMKTSSQVSEGCASTSWHRFWGELQAPKHQALRLTILMSGLLAPKPRSPKFRRILRTLGLWGP